MSAPAGSLLWLSGEGVTLGPFESWLVERCRRWEQDPRVVIAEGRQPPGHLEAGVGDFGREGPETPHQARFTVYGLNARPVGAAALLIDHRTRAAEYVIKLGPEGLDRRLATEATRLALDYGFHVADLRSIWLKVLERDARRIQAYQAAGFKQAGRLRRSGYWLGADCDEVVMDVLPEEFPGPSVARQLVAKPPR